MPDRLALHAGAALRRFLSPGRAALLGALLLAGCGAPDTRPAPTMPAAAVAPADAASSTPGDGVAPPALEDPVAQWLAQAARILRLAPADLTQEITRLDAAQEASRQAPLLLAMALAQTRQPADTARALGLVQRVLGDNAPAAQTLHPLAQLLESRLLLQRRLEEQLDRQAQQLRDSQRRNEQLNEQLEAMRAIERSLTTRPAAPPASGNGGARPRPAQ
ncbi:hypothetical protein D5041_12825 [Verminephrobacter aporrectodeae subsp. tuberculatae]|uniref:YfhG lipoprotein n=1 Tax=Verminephrobacter aporrectodeae subsp. tuberculatae TaxID=1110392 RepID=A0ABT3KQ39_9BURK|nr:hypothetical protein [Verminephrobacter aporrectodeae]MCW5220597.1 hypothetical protein [Verminephrobacter aporrectodeae subsp. tuberculatae]MCW5289892.1 hypothetical protein [Verminephrobacter aporrectodeae subsp. tuberculatae]MCW5320428.1 hypothetical protein [Verminephrobacter aporrectodeae subsp. tuberculatae]MCW8167139.1 hypothetical protein [Verminephrobacter aporrectodeae subsp. tuberculatae]MCW8171474.1 hypothetical protein [Verminephrobacter aporrectodeae subsp. tuberculatae]